MKQSIHIYTDGEKITTAVLKRNGKVVKKTEAKLHPNDTFNFNEGVKIVFDRLISNVNDVTFKPYLVRCGHYSYSHEEGYLGDIGKLSNFKDILDRDLYVGDIVQIYNNGIKNSEDSVVVYDSNCFHIMGLYSYKFSNGFDDDWKIIKVRNYSDVKDGEIIRSCVKFVKSK